MVLTTRVWSLAGSGPASVSRPSLGSLTSMYQGPIPWVNQPGHEADHSPPLSAEVKKERSYYLHVFTAQCLISTRNKLWNCHSGRETSIMEWKIGCIQCLNMFAFCLAKMLSLILSTWAPHFSWFEEILTSLKQYAAQNRFVFSSCLSTVATLVLPFSSINRNFIYKSAYLLLEENQTNSLLWNC